MKTIKRNSIENKFNYVSGDYVIEASFTKEQFQALFKAIGIDVEDGNKIEGFEFAIDSRNKSIGAVAVYGRKAPEYVKKLNGVIHNNYRLNTKVYCIA